MVSKDDRLSVESEQNQSMILDRQNIKEKYNKYPGVPQFTTI